MPAIGARSSDQEVIDELGRALTCLLAVVDRADADAGADQTLYSVCRELARETLRAARPRLSWASRQ